MGTALTWEQRRSTDSWVCALDRRSLPASAEELARRASDWLADALPARLDDPSLYHGLAGIVLALHEADQHFGDARYAAAVDRGADVLSGTVTALSDSSLYFGLAGVAFTLRALGRDDSADAALQRVRALFDGERWNEMFELLMGNAGIALGALHAGDDELALLAVTPYLTAADATVHGVNWAVRPTPPRSHHMAHGTVGIAYALAAVGSATGRGDLIELALAGAADVLGRNEAGADGFVVPHSDPPHRPELISRYSYGWCNGPVGDAQLFRLLTRVTGDATWASLADRCWRTVVASGLPERRYPGFWDNSGRCCGTAGVLALACDRIVERGDGVEFADVLVDDLLRRALVDASGARWSNHEYRATPAELDPQPGWAMGNAGIVRELLRYARLRTGRSSTYAVGWPDHLGT